MQPLLSGVLAAVLLAGAGSAAAASVEFKNIDARVVIIPEQRADVQVIFLKRNPRMPMRVEKEFDGNTLVESGDWWESIFGPHADCNGISDGSSAFVPRLGAVAYDDLPQITVRTPMDATVIAGGAIYGSAGRAHSLHLTVAGCGEWTVANVEDDLSAVYAGSGRLHTGSAGRMSLKIMGASTATTTSVQNGLDINIAGVGDVRVGQASGPIGVRMAGGGNVRVDGGHATGLDVHIAGSGDVDYGGVADSLDANIAGSGFVTAAKVTGQVTKFIAGSGSVEVGQ